MGTTQRRYVIVCHRCGRSFLSRHANSQYCDLPSEYPEDNGRTCKELQRIESKRKERARGKILRECIESGTYVMSAMYGILSREEYLSRFQEHIMKKYNLNNYAAFQRWSAENAEQLGNEYDSFQTMTGLKRLGIGHEQ